MGEHAGVRRAPCSCGEDGAVSGGRGGGDRRQMRRRRGRPCEAHAAAHTRIVPVDAFSTLDQPPELRLVAHLRGFPHFLSHRVARRVRRAYQAFARSATCAFGGGTRGFAVTLGRRRRALRRNAHAARPHAPRSSGGRGGRGARTLEATTARSRGCRNAWLPRPRAAWCGRAKQRAKQALGLDVGMGHARTRGFATLGTPVDVLCKNCEVPVALRHGHVPVVFIQESSIVFPVANARAFSRQNGKTST